MSKSKRTLAAVSASDLHLSLKPPPFRACEEDWLEVERKYLHQIEKLCTKNVKWPVPFIIAGDLFNVPQTPHEVVNLALKHLPPNTIAVAGNHDLPNHRLDDMKRSAYGVLKESKRLVDLEPGVPYELHGGATPLRLHGFPCGHPLEPLKKPNDFFLEIAVVHDMVYTTMTSHPGVSEDKRLRAYKKQMVGYDICLFGDNHKYFHYIPGDAGHGDIPCHVFNHGTFIIRKSDEREYEPRVALIYSDGSVEDHPLDTSQDKYMEDSEVIKVLENLEGNGLVEELMQLGDKALDFATYLRRLVEGSDLTKKAKSLILNALEKGEGR